MSGPTTGLRERRRAQTVAEIKQAALRELAATGPEGLSLRAVARAVGVSVQALYHYFDSREALVTALVADAFDELAAAVSAAASAAATPGERVVAAGLAYRAWGRENRSAFLLALGVPLADYAAPEGGPTSQAASRMGQAFLGAVFGGWSADELAAVPLPGDVPALHAALRDATALGGLPPGAAALFTTGWATLHGVVVLELLGHLVWVGEAGEDMCRAALLRYADELAAARR
ncbi:MAG TPA: TetR/AcrR family transcriptional regulator [Geodermatophilus sp.]|nr:TetR/AcrR family transcriptional regulator [Geodermatophilus sp.]